MRIELRLLGTSELTGPDGQSLLPVLAQPKRLALLAYLVLSRPARLHRRDALLAMFWPELDEEHARGALNQALTFLRRSLGEGIVVSQGPDLVGIAADQLECDVLRFESAATAGDHARATELYQGELLESFHVPDCQPFDLWLGSERQRLLDRALRSARIASREADALGDGTGGFLKARRALELAPYDEPAISRLMISLDLAGRRSRALEEYHAFVSRLEEDIEMEPSAELRALAEAIRTGTRNVPPREPRADPAPRESRADPAPSAPRADPEPRAPLSPGESHDRVSTQNVIRRPYQLYAVVMLAVATVATGVTGMFGLPAVLATLVVLLAALFMPLAVRLLPAATTANGGAEDRQGETPI